jgi:hypothetical protein
MRLGWTPQPISILVGTLLLVTATGCSDNPARGLDSIPYAGLETQVARTPSGPALIARYGTDGEYASLTIPLGPDGRPAGPFLVTDDPASRTITDERAAEIYRAAGWTPCWNNGRDDANTDRPLSYNSHLSAFAVSVKVMPDGRVEESGQNHDPHAGNLPASQEFLVLLPGDCVLDDDQRSRLRRRQMAEDTGHLAAGVGTVAGGAVVAVVTAPYWLHVALYHVSEYTKNWEDDHIWYDK